jgi:hypothetical protein
MDDWTAQIRAATVTLWLLSDRELTTSEIAALTGLTYEGARRLMINLSIALPITQNDGRWRRISENTTTR